MLNLRSALVLAAAGLCLWGLFSLLSSLQEPGLLRSQKATVVKGCDAISDLSVRRTCAPLFCQKALIDAKLVSWDASFALHVQRTSAADAHFDLITGTVVDAMATAPTAFACLLEGAVVHARQRLSDGDLAAFIRDVDRNPAAWRST